MAGNRQISHPHRGDRKDNPPGTACEDLPDDGKRPCCNAGKALLNPPNGPDSVRQPAAQCATHAKAEAETDKRGVVPVFPRAVLPEREISALPYFGVPSAPSVRSHDCSMNEQV
jgi:rubredoxin